MKVKWLGHATFLITAESGTKVVTDPYTTNERFLYGEIDETADIVTVSHEHGDHNNAAAVRGNPEVVRETTPLEVKGIKISGISSYHDDTEGSQRGANAIFCLEVDGIRVCHLGDLGHRLSDAQVAALGKVDVLLAPVGGRATIDAEAATELYGRLKPTVMIPMHYKTEKLNVPFAEVDGFLEGKKNVVRRDASEVEFKQGKLPAGQIIVLQPAM